MKSRFLNYFKYTAATLKGWDGTASLYDAISTTKPELDIASDASGEIGFGA